MSNAIIYQFHGDDNGDDNNICNIHDNNNNNNDNDNDDNNYNYNNNIITHNIKGNTER